MQKKKDFLCMQLHLDWHFISPPPQDKEVLQSRSMSYVKRDLFTRFVSCHFGGLSRVFKSPHPLPFSLSVCLSLGVSHMLFSSRCLRSFVYDRVWGYSWVKLCSWWPICDLRFCLVSLSDVFGCRQLSWGFAFVKRCSCLTVSVAAAAEAVSAISSAGLAEGHDLLYAECGAYSIFHVFVGIHVMQISQTDTIYYHLRQSLLFFIYLRQKSLFKLYKPCKESKYARGAFGFDSTIHICICCKPLQQEALDLQLLPYT